MLADRIRRTDLADIPGIIQCARHDGGGETVAYHDATPEKGQRSSLRATKSRHFRDHDPIVTITGPEFAPRLLVFR